MINGTGKNIFFITLLLRKPLFPCTPFLTIFAYCAVVTKREKTFHNPITKNNPGRFIIKTIRSHSCISGKKSYQFLLIANSKPLNSAKPFNRPMAE